MQRREFVAAGIALALGARRLQPGRTRAAVVIGVDKVDGLPTLRAAVSGAKSMDTWLRAEGFNVKLFTDEAGPVRAGEIFQAVRQLVNQGTIDQLVVYFAGHGFIHAYSEVWLLSDAMSNPNEAVGLVESVYLARQSGIPNVAFISDACRSRSDSLRGDQIRGQMIFPTAAIAPKIPSDIDLFLATSVGDPAWEVPIGQSSAAFSGIYTACFLDAFQHPDTSMVRTVGGVSVIPNNRLKPFLTREVPARARAVNIQLDQRPDTQVVSDETIYIGRATVVTAAPTPAGGQTEPTVADVARSALLEAGARGVTTAPTWSKAQIDSTASQSGFKRATVAIEGARPLRKPDFQTGFIISGATLESVTTSPRARATIQREGSLQLVRVDAPGPGTSVLLTFPDGTSTVVAALRDYIGTVVVQDEFVRNVSYVPNFLLTERQTAELERLRAAVAAAARFGVFRIEGNREGRNRAAASFADQIRVLKGLDPTLGLYAAYAYADAGLQNQVESVGMYMRDGLHTNVFDVALLSRSSRFAELMRPNSDQITPFCPMLSQGWNLLRAREALNGDLAELRDHLGAGLWTSFRPNGTRIAAQALAAGRLK